MLLELRISNFALIEQAEIQCGPGLNVLTGETGAGKSILIQALGLLLGERAAAEQAGAAEKAVVEGAFDLADTPAARVYLEENGVSLEDETLIVAREVGAGGRSRVRLNGRLATATSLRELGALLVDLHGQHEHQLLLRPEAHLGFLDAYGDAAHEQKRAAVRAEYSAWRAAQRRLDEVTSNEQQRAQRLDMLQFQASEIDALAPQEGEDETLVEERARLMNAEKLREAAGACRDLLLGDEEPGAVTLARQALKAAGEIEAVDTSVAAWAQAMQSAVYELEEAAAEARTYADTLEADPLRLEEVEARLHRLNRLKRKYGDSLAAVLAYRAEIEDELARLNVGEAEVAALRDEAEKRRVEYSRAAEELSQSRRKLAKRFSAEVEKQLHTLAMERARFEVSFERDEKGSAEGVDRVEFLLSANPGQPPRPLARIASGGEISRVMLGLRSVLAAARSSKNESTPAESTPVTENRVPIIVFDEIDTGIGGVTAEAVGEKMQELAKHFQVFCVTHLPQIARRADRHYRVQKESDEARTTVDVTLLGKSERVHELARMMGQESAANLRHARELLKK
jgi:DNA repair protein RecN (Recombination protein N)